MNGKIKVAGILVAIASYFVISIGFLMNSASVTVGEDDADCGSTSNPHDESEREENSCTRICETHPVFYQWGSDQDCYWDDSSSTSEAGVKP